MRRLLLSGLLLACINIHASEADVRKVFSKLVMAIGNVSMPQPSIYIINNDQLVAQTYGNGKIEIGRKLVASCSRFGTDSLNAIACILSHELAHYYQKHFWAQKFGSAYASSDWGKKIAREADSNKFKELYESQADQVGFYYAFSAGFRTWKIAPAVLDSVYKWYQFNEVMEGYPALPQRKAIASISASKFAGLIPVFEISNHLRVVASTCLGDQQSAVLDFSCFGYEHMLAANIQTAEMFNNIAVSRILKAQKYSASIYSGLQLPVILDQSSLIYEASGSKGDEELEKYNALMNEALENIEQALRLDDKYWPAIINKSIVLMGLEKYGSSEDELSSKTVKEAAAKNKSLAWIIPEVRGIMYYLKGDSAQGVTYLKQAQKAGSGSASINRLILLNTDFSVGGIDSWRDTTEKWNNATVFKGLRSYRTSTDSFIKYANSRAELLIDSVYGYKVYEFRPRIGFCPVQYVKLAQAGNAGLSTSRGLKKGQTTKELVVKYGNSDRIISGTLYTYWIYPGQNLIVTTDNTSGKVDSWLYYIIQ